MTAAPRRLAFTTVARRVSAMGLVDDGAVWVEPTESAVATLPGWVRAAGLAAADGIHWLWIDAEAGGVAGIAASQAVLNAPPGRYAIDTIDPGTGQTVAREIASAAPLVIGLPRRGRSVVLRIEAIRTTP
jgi:hypothetical protein